MRVCCVMLLFSDTGHITHHVCVVCYHHWIICVCESGLTSSVVPSDAVTSRAAQQSLISTRRTPQRLAPGMTGKCFQRLLFC